MPHPGSLGGFPGDWSYHGNARLLVGSDTQLLEISLRLVFVEEVEIDVKLIWKNIPDDKRFKIAAKMHDVRQQILIIQGSMFLIGFSEPPLNLNNGVTNFQVTRFITYARLPEMALEQDESKYFVQLRAYLNDEFSSIDEILIKEFENMPNQMYGRVSNFENDLSLYCALNSEYEVKCGKKYISHQDHNIFYRKNIDTLYKLSFIDIRVPIKNQRINHSVLQQDEKIEISLARHLEQTSNDICAFLSVICDYEILPIYYEYSIYSQNKYVFGRIIPIWSRRRIPRISKSWPTQGIHFLGNVTAFLECCPISRQLSRGIEHLKITVYESTVELKLMAACSAIEYFYSYWFWEMEGLQKLVDASFQNNTLVKWNTKLIKDLKKLKQPNESKGKTPYLSTVICFFLNDLEIDWQKYMNDRESPHFIQVRNGLLHGSFVANETEIFLAEEVGQKLGVEILISILKQISISNVSELYENLPIRPAKQVFYLMSDGWLEIKELLDELHEEGREAKGFWTRG